MNELEKWILGSWKIGFFPLSSPKRVKVILKEVFKTYFYYLHFNVIVAVLDVGADRLNMFGEYWVLWGFPGGAVVKNQLLIQETRETQVRPLGWEDPLKQEMATHSTISARKIPRTQEPGRLQSKGSQRVRHDWAHTSKLCERVSVHIMCLNSVVFTLGWLIKICIPFLFFYLFI